MASEALENLIRRLQPLIELPKMQRDKLIELVKTVPPNDLRDEDKIRELAERIGISPAIFLECFPALITVYHLSQKEKHKNFAQTLKELSKEKLRTEQIEGLVKFVSEIESNILAILEDIDREAAPEIPVPKFQRVKTRVVQIADFENEFSARDKPEEYLPLLKRKHARLLITIKGLDLELDRQTLFAFVASKDDVNHIINYLELAKKQLDLIQNSQQEESR